jgi:agmatinase
MAENMEKGPEVILQASQMLSEYDVETNTDLNELGLLTLEPLICSGKTTDISEELANQTSAHFKKNKLVAAIGGSHLISEGLVSAAAAQNNNLSVIHLGAHPHLLDPATDQPDIMARIKEKCAVSHIGIRSMTKMEKKKSISTTWFLPVIFTTTASMPRLTPLMSLTTASIWPSTSTFSTRPACTP